MAHQKWVRQDAAEKRFEDWVSVYAAARKERVGKTNNRATQTAQMIV